MYLLDTNVVSELRRPHPHPSVVRWIEEVAADELFLSAVTVGEIQAGIELTREQDVAKAEELEAWLGAVLVSYNVLPRNAATFRERGRGGPERDFGPTRLRGKTFSLRTAPYPEPNRRASLRGLDNLTKICEFAEEDKDQ